MKAIERSKFYKENIILSIIWNSPAIGLIYIPLAQTKIDDYLLIGSTAIGFFVLCIASLNKWYNDYIFEQLNNRIKKLEDESKSNNVGD